MKNFLARASLGLLLRAVLGLLPIMPVFAVWYHHESPLERLYSQYMGRTLAQTPVRTVISFFYSRHSTRIYFVLMQRGKPATSTTGLDPARHISVRFLSTTPRMFSLWLQNHVYSRCEFRALIETPLAYISREVMDEADAVSVMRALYPTHPNNRYAQFFDDQARKIASYLLTYSDRRLSRADGLARPEEIFQRVAGSEQRADAQPEIAQRGHVRMRIEGRHHPQILQNSTSVIELEVQCLGPMERWNRECRNAKQAPPPRAGKSSPSLRFAAGLRFAPHSPLRSICGRSPLTGLCYPPSLAGKAGELLGSSLLNQQTGRTNFPVERSRATQMRRSQT